MRSPIRAPLIEVFMDKQYLLREINCLIESKRLWEEMGEHIYALGGEIWDTKYVEAYYFHEELVFHLIEDFLGKKLIEKIGELAEIEFFGDCIADLSQKRTIHFNIPDEPEAPGYESIYISNANELLEYYISHY